MFILKIQTTGFILCTQRLLSKKPTIWKPFHKRFPSPGSKHPGGPDRLKTYVWRKQPVSYR